MTNRMDHSNCTHPRTPAGRRTCRAGGDVNPVRDLTVAADLVKPTKAAANHEMKSRMDRQPEIKMTGAMARKLARHAAKADAMKPKGKCVQGALHTGRGRCACGWEGK